MRKLIPLLLIIVCIGVILVSCNAKNDNEPIVFSFDDSGNYLGFANIPKDYTIDEAKKDGYYVKKGLEVDENRETWDKFIETVAKSDNVGIRILSYYEDNPNMLYFKDVFYEDEYYYLFDSTSEEQEKQPYSNLLTLEGKFGNPLKDTGVVVLTDDSELTFDKVMKSMYSSNMEYIKSIAPFRLIMFE